MCFQITVLLNLSMFINLLPSNPPVNTLWFLIVITNGDVLMFIFTAKR